MPPDLVHRCSSPDVLHGDLVVDQEVGSAEIVAFLKGQGEDMEKAYDRPEWDFLFLVLQKFGFHHQWIKYTQAMFTNCWLSLLYNGGVHCFFKSSRGLRQGDPLASTLFVIAEEVLSRGLSMAFSQRQITYYEVPRNYLDVTLLLFADDTRSLSACGAVMTLLA